MVRNELFDTASRIASPPEIPLVQESLYFCLLQLRLLGRKPRLPKTLQEFATIRWLQSILTLASFADQWDAQPEQVVHDNVGLAG